MISERGRDVRWAWLGVGLLVLALFALLSQWGGTQWSSSALVSGGIVIAVLLFVSLAHLVFSEKLSYGALLFWPWGLYVFISGVLVSVAPWDAWRSILCQLCGVVVFYVTYTLVNTSRAKWGLLLGVLFSGVICASAAYYQAYVDYEWGPFAVHRLEQYQHRMAGFFGQPNAYAAFVVLVMPIPLFYAFHGSRSRSVKIVAVVLFLFLQWAVLLGVSRGSMITLNLLFFIYAYLIGKNWKQRAFAVVVMLIAFWTQFAAFKLTQSVVDKRMGQLIQGEGETVRKIFFPIAWEMFKERPIVGYGEESFQYVWDTIEPVSLFGEEKNVHSDHLEALAEGGVIGGMLYYLPIGGLLIFSLIKLKQIKSVESKAIIGVAMIGITGFLIHGSVDFLTKYLSLVFVIFIYLAFLAQEVRFQKAQNTLLAKGVIGSVGLIALLILFWGSGTLKAISLTSENWAAIKDVEERLKTGKGVKFSELDTIYERAGLALQSNPKHVPAMLHASKALSIKAQYDEQNKVDYLDLALDINAEALSQRDIFWRAWIERVNLLRQYGGRHEEVMECYGRAIKIASGNLLLRMNYIMYLKSQGIKGAVYDTQAEFVRKMFPGHPALNDL